MSSHIHDYQFLCSMTMFYSTFIILFFFFNDTATTEIYTLSLHDALPIFRLWGRAPEASPASSSSATSPSPPASDRKSTRLNSSHEWISYAVFCLKKKKYN